MGFQNRILHIFPGSIAGTSFSGERTNLALLDNLASQIYDRMCSHATLYIPDYEAVYHDVIKRYSENPLQFGCESFEYKRKSGRISTKPQLTIGYLSGTFDLFHVGHLNLLRRAKKECDYLIVGVHESGAWKKKETFIPFEERIMIVRSCVYVDKAIMSYPEDSDAWFDYHYDKLFVGDDYKGTPRFIRYEEFFKDKDVEIIYFPYTKGTSSTQLREALKK